METNTIVLKGRIQYEHIFEPYASEINGKKNEPCYSLTLLIDKDDKETIETYKKALQEAINCGIEAGKIKKELVNRESFKKPLRDGDKEKPERMEFDNKYFISVKSNINRKPYVCINNSKESRLANPEEIYNGCYVYVELRLYAYDRKVNFGISSDLYTVIKWKDGEPFIPTHDVTEVLSKYKGETISEINDWQTNDVKETDDLPF